MTGAVDLGSQAERIERTFDYGTVVFENFGPGQWLTQKGQPAKKARRRYLINGQQVESVSEFADALRKKALENWIEREATIGAVHAERLGELQGVTEADWAYRVKSLRLGASAKREEGADRGTIVHDALHKLAVEGVAPNPADVPGVARPWVQGALRAWLALGDVQVLAAEEIVAHPDLMYAGRFDLLATVDGKTTLLDWKSGKGRVFTSAAWQSRLYSMAIERSLGIEVEQIKLIGISDDGGFEVVNCPITTVEAEALIVVARAEKRAYREMEAQRRIAETVK